MGSAADAIRKRHHDRVALSEMLDDAGPIPPQYLFSEEFRKSHKKRLDLITEQMSNACENIVPDVQILLVALSEATGNNNTLSDTYIDLAYNRVIHSGFGTTVDTKSHYEAKPRQLNVVEAISESLAEKAHLQQALVETPAPSRRRTRRTTESE